MPYPGHYDMPKVEKYLSRCLSWIKAIYIRSYILVHEPSMDLRRICGCRKQVFGHSRLGQGGTLIDIFASIQRCCDLEQFSQTDFAHAVVVFVFFGWWSSITYHHSMDITHLNINWRLKIWETSPRLQAPDFLRKNWKVGFDSPFVAHFLLVLGNLFLHGLLKIKAAGCNTSVRNHWGREQLVTAKNDIFRLLCCLIQ